MEEAGWLDEKTKKIIYLADFEHFNDIQDTLKNSSTKLNFNMTKKLPTLMGKLYLFFNQSPILWDTNDVE